MSVIEIIAGEAHDFIVHAILYLQQGDGLRVHLNNALHQGLAKSSLQSRKALDGRRKLTMVASKDDTTDTAHGNPAGSLQGLSSFVDEQGAELLSFQQTTATAHKGRGNDTCLAKEVAVDANLQLRGATFQAFQLLMKTLVTPFAMAPQLADSLSDGPELRVVRMRLEASLVGERQHLIVDFTGIADAQNIDATID